MWRLIPFAWLLAWLAAAGCGEGDTTWEMRAFVFVGQDDARARACDEEGRCDGPFPDVVEERCRVATSPEGSVSLTCDLIESLGGQVAVRGAELDPVDAQVDFSGDGCMLGYCDRFSVGLVFPDAESFGGVGRFSWLGSLAVFGSRLQPLTGPVLAGQDLRSADLEGADLRRADLTGANLAGVSLARADLSHASLEGADLTGADLRDANLLGTRLPGAELTDVRGTRLAGCPGRALLPVGWQCTKGNLLGPAANLTRADLSGAYVSGDLVGANLAEADLTGATIEHLLLDGANLEGASFADANVLSIRAVNLAACPATPPPGAACIASMLVGQNADLTSADLRGVSLAGMGLYGTKFDYSNLTGADFSGADLYVATLKNADLTGADLLGTVWSYTLCPDGNRSDLNGTSPESCCGHLNDAIPSAGCPEPTPTPEPSPPPHVKTCICYPWRCECF